MAQLVRPSSSEQLDAKFRSQLQQAREAAAAGLQEYAITGTVTWDSSAKTESFNIYVPEVSRHFTGTVTNVQGASGQAATTEITGVIDTLDALAPGSETIKCHGSSTGLYITFYNASFAAKHWITATPVPGWQDGVNYNGSGTWA